MGNLTEGIKVHRIISGPYLMSDLDDSIDPEDDFTWVEALVEFNGHLEEMTLGHQEFDKIYAIVKHLSGPTIEPYVIGKPE